MKPSFSCRPFLALLALAGLPNVGLHAQVPEPRVLSEQPFLPAEKGPNHRLLHSEKWVVEASGETNRITTSYVELASGLHFQNEQGEYQLSDPTIQIAPDGTFAAASRLEQPITFEANLNTEGSVRILTPDGQLLKATVLALAYYDPVSGADVVLVVPGDPLQTGRVAVAHPVLVLDHGTSTTVDVVAALVVGQAFDVLEAV